MSNRVRPINLIDFTGGLNLRGDAFELSPVESPDMMNVDLDARGGFVSRKGWTAWNTSDIDSTWNPRTLFVHELSDGTDRVYLANNSKIRRSSDGVTWTLLNSSTDIVADAAPHAADFAPWGDMLYIACGRSNQAVEVNTSLTVTRMTQAEAATFTAYASPSSNTMPQCDFMAAHTGFMFAASIEEDGTHYKSRVRWSHPNNPEAWAANDYIDILESGGPITGLVPMRDHLLIFKQSSVWALFGYDSDSWQLVNVSREVGAIHRQAIARTEQAVFFYSHPHGVYVVSNGESPREVSAQLRPALQGSDFAEAYTDYIWLGWCAQKLWFSCPYFTEASATNARTVFVFDPSVGEGAWVAYRAADEQGIGPFAQGGFGGEGIPEAMAAHRTQQSVLLLEDNDLPTDDIDTNGSPQNFESYYVTPWVDGGFPTLKKSWRRPDLVVKERTLGYDLQVDVYRDYDEANVVRDKIIVVDAGGTGATWGNFTWGDGTLYGPEARGSRIERGGNLGSARAVQLRLSGQIGKVWGVDAIIFKFIPRRMR
jgi:hypothetical protein